MPQKPSLVKWGKGIVGAGLAWGPLAVARPAAKPLKPFDPVHIQKGGGQERISRLA
jgi:hypothetical protein